MMNWIRQIRGLLPGMASHSQLTMIRLSEQMNR